MDFVTYLGAGIGSAIYGRMLEKYTYNNMFVSWLALALTTVVILIIFEKKEKKSDE